MSGVDADKYYLKLWKYSAAIWFFSPIHFSSEHNMQWIKI